MNAEPIENCRICGSPVLVEVLNLGDQVLTGVFPRSVTEQLPVAPLRLLKCHAEGSCGLLQLGDTFSLPALYGDSYGYRSGLNPNMVRHLEGKVRKILALGMLRAGDLVIDIGSNDGTTLGAYPQGEYSLVGVDPSGKKFQGYYPAGVELIPDFFSSGLVQARYPGRRARVITSFSMFYDLERPLEFMREVVGLLEEDGVWVTEQSYMPAMLSATSYDTVCHEHLEYYGLKQMAWMASHAGAKIVDVDFNDVNGGSFSVTLARAGSRFSEFAGLNALLQQESSAGLDGLEPYEQFERAVVKSRAEVMAFLAGARRNGKRVAALGASTKGNVLLQYCGITSQDIECVGEVNPDKFGAFTPGTLLRIVPESQLLSTPPDYLLVLPWHFRRFFETAAQFAGTSLVFPLPQLSVVQR